MKSTNTVELSAQSNAQTGDRSGLSLISWDSIATLQRAITVSDDNLTADESASTLFRFFRSEHVVDLKLIATLAILLLLTIVATVAVIAVTMPLVHLLTHYIAPLIWHLFAHYIVPSATHLFATPDNESSATSLIGHGAEAVAMVVAHGVKVLVGLFDHGIDVLATHVVPTLIAYVGPAIPICGAIVAWAYLTAASRLGVVDLFACEISTLCRVGTLFDIGKLYVDMRQHYLELPLLGVMEKRAAEQRSHPDDFVSQEDYFPIFDGNSKDLQALEALVVGNITEFYTYMKATRDVLRKLGSVNTSEAPGAAANLIYVLFLGYESGRKAVKDLIEFEPTRAENMMIILLTELTCYSALCKYFKDDELRFSRLKLREKGYKKEVPELYRQVKASHGKNEKYWEPAENTLSELARRYKEAFGEDLDSVRK